MKPLACQRCKGTYRVGPWDGTGGFVRLCGPCKVAVTLGGDVLQHSVLKLAMYATSQKHILNLLRSCDDCPTCQSEAAKLAPAGPGVRPVTPVDSRAITGEQPITPGPKDKP